MALIVSIYMIYMLLFLLCSGNCVKVFLLATREKGWSANENYYYLRMNQSIFVHSVSFQAGVIERAKDKSQRSSRVLKEKVNG